MKLISMMNVFQNISQFMWAFCAMLPIFLFGNKAPTPPNPCDLARYPHAAHSYFDFCDTCGCGSSGGSMGYGTGLNNNFLGLRYIGQEYRSRDGIFADSPWIDENFNTVQLWGNFPIAKRVLLNVMVPYQFHHRKLPDGTDQDITGLGDISILGLYNLIKANPDSIVSIKPEHYLQVGAGVKMPTGKFDRANNLGSVNPSFQLGNGSWDYILAMNYGFTHRNWGISTLFNYTIKTENPKDYKFGNQINYGINAFKTYYVSNSLSLTPIVGLAGEKYGINREFNTDVANTKGDVFLGKVSLEATYNQYSLGLLGMLPIDQNLNNGKVELKNRVSIYLNVNL